MPATDHTSMTAGPSANLQGLATARAASARFHDVRVAVAAGYFPTVPLPLVDCVVSPPEFSPAGVMGRHYVKASNFGSTDPTKPAALLYVSKPGGGLRLVAIEFLVPDKGQIRPSMFGNEFIGPMPGHGGGMPVHYDQHVWLWAHNPAGMFAPFNPAIHC